MGRWPRRQRPVIVKGYAFTAYGNVYPGGEMVINVRRGVDPADVVAALAQCAEEVAMEAELMDMIEGND